MANVKRALTRKIGPFAAWVWALIAGGALFFYQRHGGSLGGGGGSQQQTPSFYGPYGQDAFPIQGGTGTGPGDSAGSSGTDTGTNAPDAQPPTIIVNPPKPDGNPKRSRAKKDKPQHTRSKVGKGKGSDKPGKTRTNHGHPNVQTPRHPASTHPGSASRQRVNAGKPAANRERVRTPPAQHAGHSSAPAQHHAAQTAGHAAPPAQRHAPPPTQHLSNRVQSRPARKKR